MISKLRKRTTIQWYVLLCKIKKCLTNKIISAILKFVSNIKADEKAKQKMANIFKENVGHRLRAYKYIIFEISLWRPYS